MTTGETSEKPGRLAYSPQEVAGMLSVCLNRVYQMLREGELKSVRCGRRHLVTKAELERFLAANEA